MSIDRRCRGMSARDRRAGVGGRAVRPRRSAREDGPACGGALAWSSRAVRAFTVAGVEPSSGLGGHRAPLAPAAGGRADGGIRRRRGDRGAVRGGAGAVCVAGAWGARRTAPEDGACDRGSRAWPAGSRDPAVAPGRRKSGAARGVERRRPRRARARRRAAAAGKDPRRALGHQRRTRLRVPCRRGGDAARSRGSERRRLDRPGTARRGRQRARDGAGGGPGRPGSRPPGGRIVGARARVVLAWRLRRRGGRARWRAGSAVLTRAAGATDRTHRGRSRRSQPGDVPPRSDPGDIGRDRFGDRVGPPGGRRSDSGGARSVDGARAGAGRPRSAARHARASPARGGGPRPRPAGGGAGAAAAARPRHRRGAADRSRALGSRESAVVAGRQGVG